MSDLVQFCDLMDHSGFKYDIEVDTEETFLVNQNFENTVGGTRRIPIFKNMNVTLMTVQGGFYDELYVYFDPDTDELLELQSHVMKQIPKGPKLRKKLGMTDAG